MAFLYNIILIIQLSGKNLYSLLPYIFTGIFLSGFLNYTSWTGLIQNYTVRFPRFSVFISVLAGIASPLCTFGTVPVVLQLFLSGVPLSPLVAFMSASSMMNPQLFLLTAGGIGVEIAVVRLAFVLLFSLFLGFLVHFMPAERIVKQGLIKQNLTTDRSPTCRLPGNFSWKAYFSGCLKSLEYVGFYMTIGVILGAAVEVLVPQEIISGIFTADSWLAVLSASLLGIPLYACGGAVIPFIGSMIKEGMSKGAALAFLTVGQATRIQPLAALSAIFRPAFIVLYIVLLLIFSLLTGIVYR